MPGYRAMGCMAMCSPLPSRSLHRNPNRQQGWKCNLQNIEIHFATEELLFNWPYRAVFQLQLLNCQGCWPALGLPRPQARSQRSQPRWQPQGAKTLQASPVRRLQGERGDKDAARLLATHVREQSGIWRATTSAGLAPGPEPGIPWWKQWSARLARQCTRHKPSQQTKTTAEVLEQHLSTAPISTSISLHHPWSNPLKDDSLVKDACIGHEGLMFAGAAGQSSRAALGSPGPGSWLLRNCFCSTCNFTHHCIGLVILQLEPCFAIRETLVPRQKNSTGFLWITDSKFQATYSKT